MNDKGGEKMAVGGSPAWKVRDETISEAYREFIKVREAAWKAYFEAEKKPIKK
jgi:hypothetical protein